MFLLLRISYIMKMDLTESNIVLNQWNDRIVFVWILFVLKQNYEFVSGCAKTDPCEISSFQLLFVIICENDFISIATSYICYFLLFYYILVLLFSFILAISDYSTLTYLIFTVFYSMEYTNKPKYTINHKYTLFYLPIQNNNDDDDDKTSTIHNQYYWE